MRYIGVVAQDFRAAFGFGEKDKTLHAVDANGVTMAAVQDLYQIIRRRNDRSGSDNHGAPQLRRAVKQQRERRRSWAG